MPRAITALTLLAALAAAPLVRAEAPPETATPRAECGPGSLPEPGLQGRVPRQDVDSGAAAAGYRCNVEVVGHTGRTGGFKVLRYVDRAGHECAYYDTTLLFPSNALDLSMQPTGVAVLDMRDPAHPLRTTTLESPAMQTPHESLSISTRRGLLVAVAGNSLFAPGQVDVYDLNRDCRYPQLRSTAPVGFLGHESGMAPDGRTFYATSLGTGQTTPVDISDPSNPRMLGVYEFNAHGMTVSDDGTRGYMASLSGLRIVDLTQVQERRPNPQIPEISRTSWPNMTIPQVAHPITIGGRPYLVEVDEYSSGPDGKGNTANGPRVGAARIIDIADERHPKVVSNIRLDVHQPEHRAEIADDYGAQSPTQGYAAHYCNVPTRTDPTIVACSMILSGLRVFDIRDPYHPRELAYFVAPPNPGSLTGPPNTDARANWAMSQPEFVPERREVWYSDGNSGLWVLRLAPGAWPDRAPGQRPPEAAPPPIGGPAACPRARLSLARLADLRIVRVVATRGGRRVGSTRGHDLRAIRVARAARASRVRLRLTVRSRRGRTWTVTTVRRVGACPRSPIRQARFQANEVRPARG